MMLSSFADELLKIARDFKTHRGLQGKLEPGDILLTSFKYVDPAKMRGRELKRSEQVAWNAFRAASRKYQGEHEHSAIYAGRGKVIETGPPRGAEVKRLEDMTGGRGPITAVRPDVSATQRRRAVQRARQLVGTKYSVPRLVRAGMANHVRLKPEKVPDRRKHQYICSTLVGDAFDQVPFNSKKPNDALMPADFYRSGRTKVVGKKVPS
jgi:cell wall-associated NlpC family hydrolase